MSESSSYSLEVVAPIFTVSDITSSLHYYKTSLHFTEAFSWQDADNKPLSYGILQQNNTELHLTLASVVRPSLAYFFVNEIDAFYDAAKSNSAMIKNQIENQPWEMREFEVTDLDGNRIVFGEHLSRL